MVSCTHQNQKDMLIHPSCCRPSNRSHLAAQVGCVDLDWSGAICLQSLMIACNSRLYNLEKSHMMLVCKETLLGDPLNVLKRVFVLDLCVLDY